MMRQLLKHVRGRYIFNGFFSVFGLVDPMVDEVKSVMEHNVLSALKSDREKLDQDFKRVFNKEAHLVDETYPK